MDKLSFEVKDFIEDNIDLIDANAWDQVFDNAIFNLDSESQGILGKALLDSGLDPLKDLDYIPDYFLSSTNIKSFTIPNHIHLLSEGCFSYCQQLDQINIPESVTEIAQFAFYDCENLKHITIPESVTGISITAFDGIHEDATIYCKQGSYADYYAQEQHINVEYLS